MVILHSAQVPVAWPESNCTPETGANAYFQSTMLIAVDTKKGAEAPYRTPCQIVDANDGALDRDSPDPRREPS